MIVKKYKLYASFCTLSQDRICYLAMPIYGLIYSNELLSVPALTYQAPNALFAQVR